MKKLKRFLLISLLSFVFLIGNVYATTSNYSMELKYSDTFYEQVINASDRINKLHTYLENRNNGNICFDNICNNINSGNVALIYRYIDTDNWLVSLVNNNYMKTFYSSSNVNSSYMQIYFSHMTQFNVSFNSSNNITSFSGYMTGTDNLWFSLSGIDINNSDYTAYQSYKYVDTYYLNDSQVIQYNSGSGGLDIKLNINNIIYTPVVNINAKELLDSMIPIPPEPSYTMSQQILENGNVKLTFNFTNYETNNGYGFTITNKVSGEEYGISNPFTSVYPNIIPFGNTYEIIIPYDTIINVSLSKYTLIEGTELYDREPLYVDSYDISNIVFDNVQNPYFSIISQTQNNLIGRYNNTKSGDICGHIYSNNNVEWTTNCNEVVDIDFSLNGYVEMYVKRNNNIIYSRKINYISQNQNMPYITWNIDKQDFYSIINWTIKNYDNQMTYRFSKDNGATYTNWNNATENNYINVYDNNTIIIEIANSDQSIIYDTKAINVVNDISSLNNKNNTTNNIINKFNDIFNVNGNILQEIERYWGLLKNSKIYLIIFIPFITSIICAIIYLIRRA